MERFKVYIRSMKAVGLLSPELKSATVLCSFKGNSLAL